MKNLIEKSISNALSYQSYVKLVEQCVINQRTTGTLQTQERIEFTKLNSFRMKRFDKKIVLLNEVENIFKNVHKQIWIVILESWCGDGAQTVPILNKIAKASPQIELKIVLRDENPEFMNTFLTNGAQAIPKLIIVDENYTVLDIWGARSKAATKLVIEYKKQFGAIDTEFKKNLQLWYNKDKGISIINDLIEIVTRIKNSTLV